MITVRTSPAYVNRVRQDWTANGGVYGDGGVYAVVPSNDPFAQLGPTLDLTFAGVPTNQLTAATVDGYSINLNLSSGIYQIAAQYTVWTATGLTQVNFADVVTFTRTGSTATYFNSAGVLTTAAADQPRFDYNPSTLAAQGLLIEEARTNLITSSAVLPAGVNVTITADTFIAPDGTTTGDQILDNATLGEHYSDSSFTPVAATNYTFSAFIKNIGASSSGFACLRLAGDFTAFVIVNLSTFTAAVTGGAQYVSSSIQAINNGWYRITLTGVSVGTVASVARVQVTDAANLIPYSGTGKGFAVWGRQLEAGAFPTSYIPTTSGQVTRNPDQASVNTLSPWFNATAGTVYAEFLAGVSVATQQSVFDIDNSSDVSNNRISWRMGNEFVISAGSAVVNFFITPTASATSKWAFAFTTDDFAFSRNGGAPSTDSSGALPSGLNRMLLGNSNSAAGTFLNGYLRRIVYYPRRLANADLQTITI